MSAFELARRWAFASKDWYEAGQPTTGEAWDRFVEVLADALVFGKPLASDVLEYPQHLVAAAFDLASDRLAVQWAAEIERMAETDPDAAREVLQKLPPRSKAHASLWDELVFHVIGTVLVRPSPAVDVGEA